MGTYLCPREERITVVAEEEQEADEESSRGEKEGWIFTVETTELVEEVELVDRVEDVSC